MSPSSGGPVSSPPGHSSHMSHLSLSDAGSNIFIENYQRLSILKTKKQSCEKSFMEILECVSIIFS